MIKLEAMGMTVSLVLICTEFHEMERTGQKLCFIMQQRSEKMRAEFMNQVMYVYACKYVCFHIDETGSDQHDLHNQQGCGLCGAATVSLKFHIRGKRISAIAANTIRGVEDFFSIRFSNNFREYICNSSLPVLHPFKGSSKHLIVTMASASIHRVDEVCGLNPLLASIGMVLSSLQP